MKHELTGSCGVVEIRPLMGGDIEPMRRLRNKNRHMFVLSSKITLEEQQVWYARYLHAPGDYMFSVYFENHWIGAVAVYEVKDNCAEFGRLLIDRAAAGRGGLGVDATKAACQIAFEQLGVERITLTVYCDNPAAQITYLKAGFCPVSISQENNQKPMVHMILLKSKALLA